MEMMEGEPLDFDYDVAFPEDMEEDEDEVMGGLISQAPQMFLGDLFEELANDPHSPLRQPRRSVGWSCDDLGGEGMTVESFFETETTPTTVTVETENSSPSLCTIQWDDLQTMHPNKIFAISVEYIVRRAPQLATPRRISGQKTKPPWRYQLALVAKDPFREFDIKMNARRRGDAYYTLVAWISRLSGRSVRVVKKEMNDEWLLNRKWQQTDDSVKRRFHFLREIEKEPAFQKAFPEFNEQRVNGRATSTSLVVVGERSEEPLPVTQCHGYLATYNTSLGLHDPQVLAWVQQGLRGGELGEKLKNHELHKAAFRRFVNFHKDVADKHHFRTWAVALEHSTNGDHPARVHLHVYAGVDIRGGHLMMGMPQTRPVSKSSLEWPGCKPPFVRFTTIRRPSPSTILVGVSTGMYYVAGAKASNLMLEASMAPFLDVAVSKCCQSEKTPLVWIDGF